MVQTVTPFLMFEGDAEEAIILYASLFRDAEIHELERYGAGEAGVEGTIRKAHFSLAGQRFMAIDSPESHDFGFTPALSLFVECGSIEEINGAFRQLSAGGRILMPLDNYGFSARFGWLNDRFGVSWQLNLGSRPGAT